jgi:hypothetical protein
MTKQRKLKDHPAVDPDKPSLVLREALDEELRRAMETLKPTQNLQDVTKQWQEFQKALQEALKPAPQSQDVAKQWQVSKEALQEALKPAQNLQDVANQWQVSQKALQEAVAPSKEYLNAINKAEMIAGIARKHEKG